MPQVAIGQTEDVNWLTAPGAGLLREPLQSISLDTRLGLGGSLGDLIRPWPKVDLLVLILVNATSPPFPFSSHFAPFPNASLYLVLRRILYSLLDAWLGSLRMTEAKLPEPFLRGGQPLP